MLYIKNIVRKYFRSFTYFYQYLRNRIFVAISLSIMVSILDGFGLAMFLPLLQVVDNSKAVDASGMGNLGFLVEGIQSSGIELTIGIVLLFMFLFFLMKGVVSYFSKVYIIILQQAFIKKIRLKLLHSLNRMSFKSFVTSDAGRIQNTMSGEVDKVALAYTVYFGAFQQAVMIMVYMAFAFFVDLQFALLVSIGGLVTSLIFKYIYKKTKGASRNLTTSNNQYQGEVIQHVGNFKYLKATGLVDQYAARLSATIDNIEVSRKKIGVLASAGSSVREPILVLIVASVILIQTQLLGGSLGTILISLLFFYRALASLMSMQQQWNTFMSVSGSLENMQDFQKELETEVEKNGHIPFLNLDSGIDIEKVDFSYGETKILNDVNLQILKNESIAFVGESGSGKTTLVNILAGLLPIDSGKVLINGISIADLDKRSYQKRIGYITQDPVIFNDSIFNNVTFWAEPTAENIKRFEEVVQQASIMEFIQTLPKGKEMELGNNGINLSGGQKQRISIARELYKDIDILIMDEATSALDSETELAIQQSIEALKGQYTLLIVAHRLSTIKNVDRIIVMKKGKIESQGNFEFLIKNTINFKKMVELQEI